MTSLSITQHSEIRQGDRDYIIIQKLLPPIFGA